MACRSWTWTAPGVNSSLVGLELPPVGVGDVVAVVVGAAVGEAGLDAAAGEPDREAARMMVAAVVGRGERALRVRRAAELAAPDDERVVEHAALLEVDDQRGGGLIGFARTGWRMPSGRVAVVVPALVVELDEAHAALGQPAGEQAVGGERAGRAASSGRRGRTDRLAARCERSVTSGTLVCMRNAISYWAIRDSISGSSSFSN